MEDTKTVAVTVPPERLSDQLKHYREEGIMVGAFRWLDGLGRSIGEITQWVINGFVRELGPDPVTGWRRCEPIPEREILLTFADGTTARKLFTPEELSGGEQPCQQA